MQGLCCMLYVVCLYVCIFRDMASYISCSILLLTCSISTGALESPGLIPHAL